METQIFIGVGANISPEENILCALDMLKEGARVTGCSNFYRTRPVDRPTQEDFYNGVWQICSPLSAVEIREQLLRKIEKSLNRVRTADPSAARTIDLDLLVYGDLVMDIEPVLPSPDIAKRSFVAGPLFDLAGDIDVSPLGDSLKAIVETMDLSKMVLLGEFTAKLKTRIK